VSAAGSRLSVPRSRRWAVATVAAVALVPLAGCAAGVRAETSRERPTIDGIGSAVGTLSIRNAYVGGPAENGASAPVLLSVFNNGTEPDRLVGISSPVAGSSSVPADTTLAPGGQQLFYTAGRTPRLTGLTSAVKPGQIVPVVLSFEKAGELRMSLPVSAVPPEILSSGESASPSASASATPSASASPGASASPSAGASGSPSASPSASIAP
jgi:copper(I)-binding protein